MTNREIHPLYSDILVFYSISPTAWVRVWREFLKKHAQLRQTEMWAGFFSDKKVIAKQEEIQAKQT